MAVERGLRLERLRNGYVREISARVTVVFFFFDYYFTFCICKPSFYYMSYIDIVILINYSFLLR